MEQKSLRRLKGIGEKTEKLFQKAGINNCHQLLHYYPRDYDAFAEPLLISQLRPGEVNTVIGTIYGNVSVRTFGRNSITMAYASSGDAKMQVNWFHMPFLRNKLKAGSRYIFKGPVVEKSGRMIMEHPTLYSPAEYSKLEGRLLPIYSLTAGLSNHMVQKTLRQLLETEELEKEFMPDEIRESNHLVEINFALRQIHFPANKDFLFNARKRLVFDEFFLYLLRVATMKAQANETPNYFPMKASWKTEDVIESLPYRLTKGQQRVWSELERDLTSPHLMNRLIQGDVGSGKTILAFLAMILTAENQYQSALMVPTEVLAVQHYEEMRKLAEKNAIDPAGIVLLTGSSTAKQKREIYERIASGQVQIIIGTHALIQEKLIYHKLALVITDEQHRFGVRQRAALLGDEKQPHVLVMSATPIPRTLAMILYGELDISVLDELPARRQKIKNCVVNTSYRPTAYRFISKEVAAGHQAYVICPMVEENEELKCENVLSYTEKLKEHFKDEIRVAALHGRMKPVEKNQIMQDFAEGKIQVLVSTTVVEVGVNVPNATVMMIENAERFGLAQLHQLRGRVGRGEAQSYCIFIQGNGNEEITARLKILNQSNDGFYIAEQDLKLRGPGDLFGTRQSGEAMFRMADIYQDSEILYAAQRAVQDVIHMDPMLELPQNRLLKEELDARTIFQNDDIFL